MDPSGLGYCDGCRKTTVYLRVCPRFDCHRVRCDACMPAHLDDHDGISGISVDFKTDGFAPIHSAFDPATDHVHQRRQGMLNGSAKWVWGVMVGIAFIALLATGIAVMAEVRNNHEEVKLEELGRRQVGYEERLKTIEALLIEIRAAQIRQEDRTIELLRSAKK